MKSTKAAASSATSTSGNFAIAHVVVVGMARTILCTVVVAACSTASSIDSPRLSAALRAPAEPGLAIDSPRRSEPRYRTVHIDTLAPGRAAEFEAARRDWVAVLHAAHATDHRGTYYEVDGV